MTLVRTKSNKESYQGLFDNLIFPKGAERNGNGTSASQTFFPKVNIKEVADEFLLELAAPGMEKNDFKIQLDEGLLTVSSDKKEEDVKEGQRYSKKEFTYLTFKRAFTLPEIADAENIGASYLNGILLIRIPKKEEARPKPRRSIQVT